MLPLLLTRLALAAPPLPAPHDPMAGECPRTTAQATPCAAAVVPNSRFQDLLDDETYAHTCADTYDIDTLSLMAQLKASQADVAAKEREAAALRAALAKPTPFLRRPAVNITLGVVGTLAVVVLGAEVVSAAGGK